MAGGWFHAFRIGDVDVQIRGVMSSGRALCALDWRMQVIALMIALVTGASVSFVWHADLGEDDNCVLCHLRENSLANLDFAAQLDPLAQSEPVSDSLRFAWIASYRGYQVPLRGPPA